MTAASAATVRAPRGITVALFAAAMVERSFPEDDRSLQRANDLETRLDRMLTDLIAANADANDQDNDEGAYGLDVVPLYSFPAAVAWGDSYL